MFAVRWGSVHKGKVEWRGSVYAGKIGRLHIEKESLHGNHDDDDDDHRHRKEEGVESSIQVNLHVSSGNVKG